MTPRLGACAFAVAALVFGVAAAAQPADRRGLAASSSNSATLIKERQIRARLSAAGFTDIVNLDEDAGGTWFCRALRAGTTVRVEIDRRGDVSIA